MKLYYVYPYVSPMCGSVTDYYDELKKKYYSLGEYENYWNSELRMLLRRYGLPMDYRYKSAMKKLIGSSVGADLISYKAFSNWLHNSLAYKEIAINPHLSFEEKKSKLNDLLVDFVENLRQLEYNRKRLNGWHKINISINIKRVNHHPAVGSEQWESGHLIFDPALQLKVKKLLNHSFPALK